MRGWWSYGVWAMLWLMVSCSGVDSCQQDLSNTAMVASLYRMVYDDESEVYEVQSYAVPMVVQGVGRDSLLYDSVGVSVMALPLQSHDTVTEFSLRAYRAVNDSVVEVSVDTLSVRHENRNTLVSLECGCVVDYVISGVGYTVHGIDSVIVENSGVSYQTTDNNLRIYYKNR